MIPSRATPTRLGVAILSCICSIACPLIAEAQERQPILFDTDLGSDMDDAPAGIQAIPASPELDFSAA